MKVLRGGSWILDPRLCRAAYRNGCPLASVSPNLGFRVVAFFTRSLFDFPFSCIDQLFTMTTSNHTISASALNLPMVSIAPGRFMMGSDSPSAFSDEKPVHEVIIDKGFEMAETPTTQAQWRWVAENLPKVERDLDPNPSRFKGDDRPVECVSWYDAMEFCARLSRATGKTYTLPTEEQWEYACRAGTTTEFAFGDTLDESQARFNADSTCDVKQYQPNAWGLYDMHGQVFEWCLNEYRPY
jgi:formylglycine-generating enzyme required for sulfatase activity